MFRASIILKRRIGVVGGQPPSFRTVLLFQTLETATGHRPPLVWNKETYDKAGVL